MSTILDKFYHNMNLLTKEFLPSKIAIAVSGGADSIALLSLTAKWAQDNNVALTVMTVDHHMREQSKLENVYVKDFSQKLGAQHFQLDFDHQNNFSNFQARAREERYRLMTNLCKKLDILMLLSAHHLNDYVENFCIRKARKSGIFGLSSSNINWHNNTQIIRPLFNIPKQDLIDYLITNNIKWFEDESNLSDKYQRNVIRKNLANCNIKYIINEQERINQLVENTLKPEFIAAVAESITIYEFGFAYLNIAKFSNFSEEIKIQLFNFILIIISGSNLGARFRSLDFILNSISSVEKFKKTIHGCVIKKINNNLLIYREFGKKRPDDVNDFKSFAYWDRRFYIHNIDLENAWITYLTVQDYSSIKKYLNLELLKDLTQGNHFEILFTFPVIKIFEKVMAIPHISYYDSKIKNIDVVFHPEFTSRFTHFC